jgi:hypothetical protein
MDAPMEVLEIGGFGIRQQYPARRKLTIGFTFVTPCHRKETTTYKPKTVSKKGGLRCQAEKNDSSGCKKTGGNGRPENASGRRENH